VYHGALPAHLFCPAFFAVLCRGCCVPGVPFGLASVLVASLWPCCSGLRSRWLLHFSIPVGLCSLATCFTFAVPVLCAVWAYVDGLALFPECASRVAACFLAASFLSPPRLFVTHAASPLNKLQTVDQIYESCRCQISTLLSCVRPFATVVKCPKILLP
jgi:hypothetical protein